MVETETQQQDPIENGNNQKAESEAQPPVENPEKKKKEEKAREKELKKLKAVQKAEAVRFQAQQVSNTSKVGKRKNSKEGGKENLEDPETPFGEKKHLSRQMTKQFNPTSVEKSWYACWEKSGFFVEDSSSSKPPFVIVQLPEGVPPFICINQNDFSGRKHKKLKEEDIAICECKYDADDLDSACGEGCLNGLTSTECTPGYCPCGDYCKNQRFQRSEYAKTAFLKTDGRGWGLLADENITAGQFVIEYCGEVISAEEAEQRSQAYEAQGLKDVYIISLNANLYIDATKKGSLARFINHSCEPNCETRKWTILGEIRVGIFAMQDIYVGTELVYDYNFEWCGGANVRCLCGAFNCCKFLGAKSPAFLEHNHVWEEGDDRYTVEEIPLYDSAEDELSLKLLKDKQRSFGKEFLARRKNAFPVVIECHVGSEPQRLYSHDSQHAFPLRNTFTSLIKSSTSSSRNYQIGLGSVTKKRSHFANRKSKHNSGKQLDGKRVAQLFTSKKAQEEIIKCEEIKNQSASKLNSSYDEIRPAIEEHERDSQDNVDISAAMKWICASCSNLKADFDFHFSIVKNFLSHQAAYGESKPFEESGNESGVKDLAY